MKFKSKKTNARHWHRPLLILSIVFLSLLARARDEIVMSCSIFNRSGELLRQYPGSLCRFFPDGRLLSRSETSLILYDPQMKPLWTISQHFHHLINMTEAGKILASGSSVHDYQGRKTRFDVLLLINLKGEIESRYDFYDHLNEIQKVLHLSSKRKLWPFNWDNAHLTGAELEYSHTNSIYEIPDNVSAKAIPAMKKGNLILNPASLGQLVIMDPKMSKILWHMRYQGDRHDVQVLSNGHLLMYLNDNPVAARNFSSLVELDPVSKKVVWRYQASPPEKFYSEHCGGVQILANDDVLFSDYTHGGAAIIIDRQGHPKSRIGAPFIDPKTGLAEAVQDAKSYDLSSFLKNNHGI